MLSDRHIVHRDVSPSNVYSLSEKTVMLCDFGFALDLAKSSEVEFAGTIRYAASDVLHAYTQSPQGKIKWLPRHDLESAVKMFYTQRNIGDQRGLAQADSKNHKDLVERSRELERVDRWFADMIKAAREGNHAQVKQLMLRDARE
jgi:serine/threonine protein kinase